jgi:hypothetical protein
VLNTAVMDTNPIGYEWKFASRDAACSTVDDRLYAVLYWSEGFAHQPIGGEALENSPAGWYLMFADAPDEQLLITSRNPSRALAGMSDDMSPDERHDAMNRAMDFVGPYIEQRVAATGVPRAGIPERN